MMATPSAMRVFACRLVNAVSFLRSLLHSFVLVRLPHSRPKRSQQCGARFVNMHMVSTVILWVQVVGLAGGRTKSTELFPAMHDPDARLVLRPLVVVLVELAYCLGLGIVKVAVRQDLVYEQR